MKQALKVWSYYRNLAIADKIIILLRILSCPFSELISYIPIQGTLLDVGSGYGLLTLQLTLKGFKGQILGLDPDEQKIEKAKKAIGDFKNLRFVSGTIDSLRVKQKFSLITIIDVLYLLPEDEKLQLLKKAYKFLLKNGKIIIKINDRSLSLPFFLTRLQEYLTVHVFKKTSTKHTGLYFENTTELSGWLKLCGFKIEKIIKLSTPFPFFHPHHLVIAVK